MEVQVRSRHFCEFLSKVCTFSVFEQLVNKNLSCSICSSPSPFGQLRDCLVAETVQILALRGELLVTVQTLQLPGELLVSAQPLVCLGGYRFSLLDGGPDQVLAVCEEFPVHGLVVRGEFPVQRLELVESWFFSTKEELVCQLVHRGVLSVEVVRQGVLSKEGVRRGVLSVGEVRQGVLSEEGVRRGVLSVEGVSRGVLSVEGDFV